MKHLIAVAVFAVAVCACKQKEAPAAAPAAPAAAGFEFTVQKNGDSFAFKPVRGVEWKELAYACKGQPCEFKLDNTGVNSAAAAPAFAIAFKVAGKDVDMTAVSGAKWQTLKYSCQDKACSFTVNEAGVAGAK